MTNVRVTAAQIEPTAEHDGVVVFLFANIRWERSAERIAEHPLHRRPVKLDVVVTDDEDRAVPFRHELSQRLEPAGMVLDDHLHLELALPLFASQASRTFQPIDAPIVARHTEDVVEVENVTVQEQLYRPSSVLRDVLQKRCELVIDEELAAFVRHPQGPPRVRLLRLR